MAKEFLRGNSLVDNTFGLCLFLLQIETVIKCNSIDCEALVTTVSREGRKE